MLVYKSDAEERKQELNEINKRFKHECAVASKELADIAVAVGELLHIIKDLTNDVVDEPEDHLKIALKLKAHSDFVQKIQAQIRAKAKKFLKSKIAKCRPLSFTIPSPILYSQFNKYAKRRWPERQWIKRHKSQVTLSTTSSFRNRHFNKSKVSYSNNSLNASSNLIPDWKTALSICSDFEKNSSTSMVLKKNLGDKSANKLLTKRKRTSMGSSSLRSCQQFTQQSNKSIQLNTEVTEPKCMKIVVSIPRCCSKSTLESEKPLQLKTKMTKRKETTIRGSILKCNQKSEISERLGTALKSRKCKISNFLPKSAQKSMESRNVKMSERVRLSNYYRQLDQASTKPKTVPTPIWNRGIPAQRFKRNETPVMVPFRSRFMQDSNMWNGSARLQGSKNKKISVGDAEKRFEKFKRNMRISKRKEEPVAAQHNVELPKRKKPKIWNWGASRAPTFPKYYSEFFQVSSNRCNKRKYWKKRNQAMIIKHLISALSLKTYLGKEKSKKANSNIREK